jgi:hypothetical protein
MPAASTAAEKDRKKRQVAQFMTGLHPRVNDNLQPTSRCDTDERILNQQGEKRYERF